MRKRYQTVHRREPTAYEREVQSKKGASSEKDALLKRDALLKKDEASEKYKHHRYDGKKDLAVDLSSTNLPPAARMLLLSLIKARQQQKQTSLLPLMIVIALGGIFMSFTLNGEWGRVGGDVFDSVFGLVFVGIALMPIIIVMSVLKKFLPGKVVAWAGGLMALGMIFAFLSYIISRWGGGY